MAPRLFLSLVGIVATSFFFPIHPLRAQDCCQANSDSSARADQLLQDVGNACDAGCEDYSWAWGTVRRALKMVPLSHDRLIWLLQFSNFVNQPDSAVAMANFAREHWPDCALTDSALVQAKALPPQRRRH